MECDDIVRADHPDLAVAGKALLGSSCYVTCRDGFKFADHTEPKFKLTCRQFWYHSIEWDVVGDAWDKYDNSYLLIRLNVFLDTATAMVITAIIVAITLSVYQFNEINKVLNMLLVTTMLVTGYYKLAIQIFITKLFNF